MIAVVVLVGLVLGMLIFCMAVCAPAEFALALGLLGLLLVAFSEGLPPVVLAEIGVDSVLLLGGGGRSWVRGIRNGSPV